MTRGELVPSSPFSRPDGYVWVARCGAHNRLDLNYDSVTIWYCGLKQVISLFVPQFLHL